ncbi:MAG: GspH/FimT family pseudopilin [Gammaproteobacteria bacterium]|nr:GspH/FimT family pseudopilin [Gammaproteobacteria bacterium]
MIEVLLVVAILAITASVALPTLSSADSKYLDIAANDLAQAIRFARSEAIRTGQPHGINLDESDTRFRLYVYTSSAEYIVRNPLDKSLYQLNFGTGDSRVAIAQKAIKFQGLSVNYQSYIVFAGGTGVPVSGSAGSPKTLESAEFVLQHGVDQRKVQVAPVSARVTVL